MRGIRNVVARRGLRRSLLAGAFGVAVFAATGTAVEAQPRVIGMEFGCVDWNADQGCMEYTACYVYADLTYHCYSYYRGSDY